MMKVFSAESQGNKIYLYHGGYLSIATRFPHTGFQLDQESADALVGAIRKQYPMAGRNFPLSDTALAQLRKWGYDPNLMMQDGWGRDGYLELVEGEDGRPVHNGSDFVKVFKEWKDPSHFEFLIRGES